MSDPKRSLIELNVEVDLPTSGPLPRADRREDAEAYALVKSGPPIPAETCEGEASCVEIRVLWGSTLLATHHVAPTSTFRVGDGAGCDFALPVPAFSLVAPGAKGACVTIPSGANGSLSDGEGLSRSLEMLAAREGSAAKLRTLELEPGSRVTMALSLGGAGVSAYRGVGDRASPSPVGFEIGMTRAGRSVGRGRALPPLGWVLGVAATVAVCALPLALEPPQDEPSEDQHREHLYAIQHALLASEPPDIRMFDIRGEEGFIYPPRFKDRGDPIGDLGLNEVLDLSREGLLWCNRYPPIYEARDPKAAGYGMWPRSLAPSYVQRPLDYACAEARGETSPVRQFVELPLLDPDRPPDSWFKQMAAFVPVYGPSMTVEIQRVEPNEDTTGAEAVDRAVRERRHYLAACGALNGAKRATSVAVRLVGGWDGRVEAWSLTSETTSSNPQAPLPACVTRALDGLVIAPSAGVVASFQYRITLHPHGSDAAGESDGRPR